jgi:GR25 family glycosyltransferase involved in LPS biosynthesis
MAKSKGSAIIVAIIILVVVAVVAVVAARWFKSVQPSIDDIWVINLDKDTARLEDMIGKQKYLPKPIQRWAATYGREEERKPAEQDGVDPIITKSSNKAEMDASSKVLRVGGEVGCWLSHKRVLKHLHNLNVGPDYGHLILEDDVVIPTDFTARWNRLRDKIPSDWDVVYLGAGFRNGTRINSSLLKWKNDVELANLGTYAYLVRHRVLPKLLDKMRHMFAPVDVQYYRTFGDLNVYLLDPPLLIPEPDSVSKSSVH